MIKFANINFHKFNRHARGKYSNSSKIPDKRIRDN